MRAAIFDPLPEIRIPTRRRAIEYNFTIATAGCSFQLGIRDQKKDANCLTDVAPLAGASFFGLGIGTARNSTKASSVTGVESRICRCGRRDPCSEGLFPLVRQEGHSLRSRQDPISAAPASTLSTENRNIRARVRARKLEARIMRIGCDVHHGFREGRGWRGAGWSGRLVVGSGSRSGAGAATPLGEVGDI
jgi:hypothetical protein